MMKQITQYKEKIKNAELENAKLQGQLENIAKQLKDDFGIENEEDSQKELLKLNEKKTKLKESIDKKMNKLKSDFDWEDK